MLDGHNIKKGVAANTPTGESVSDAALRGESAMLSLAIRNANLVDGTGAAPVRADVGVVGDRIVSIGRVEGVATVEIDAAGQTLSPGFIDIHTHYDPQLCWDRYATPTPEHGVTSLVMGNCSISLSPVRAKDRQRAIHLFGSVEDMEGRLLEATVPFSWETAPEYLAYLKQGLGPNVASLVGHAMVRLYVMGDAAQARAATETEVAQMCAIMAEAMTAGALGLSFTFNHFDERGRPLPSHYSDRQERLRLLQTLAKSGRGVVEVAPNFFRKGLGLEEIDFWGELALETGVTTSLSPILVMPNMEGAWQIILERFEHWRARGAPLFGQTQVRPLDMTLQLSKGSAILSKATTWRESFELPHDQRLSFYGDPTTRAQLVAEGERLKAAMQALTVKRGRSPATVGLEGRKLTEIAAERAEPFTETMLDIAIADDLETEFALDGFLHSDEDKVAHLLKSPAVHIGSGDAGAHISQFAGAGDTSYLFERFVRQRGDLSLPEAVRRLTSELADHWGFQDRGRIVPGAFADLTLFDPKTIARGDETWVDDVPGGQGRYIRRPTGISRVIVNGEVLVADGAYAQSHPGRLI